MIPNVSPLARLDGKIVKTSLEPKTGAKQMPAPFKKAQSQSHIQVRINHSPQVFIEHEKKKLKKSRSFDKNNYSVDARHTTDSKKSKQSIKPTSNEWRK